MGLKNAQEPVVFGHGHIGTATTVREYEDRHYCGTIHTQGGLKITLAIVADGVGGWRLGQRAAQLTVDTIVEYCQSSSTIDVPQLLGMAIGAANRKVYDERSTYSDRGSMSTTVAVAAIANNRLYVANVGDSRVYLIRDGKQVLQVTVDHIWALERIREGKLSEEEALRHPSALALTRSVGNQPNIQVDLGLYLQGGQENGQEAYRQQGFALGPNDVILVCSDGLIKRTSSGEGFYVSQKEIADVIARSTAEQAAKKLVDIAMGKNVDDNVTAVVVEMPGRSRSLPRIYLNATAALFVSASLLFLFAIAFLVIPKLIPPPPSPTAQQDYARVYKGNLLLQVPGSDFQPISDGDSIPFGQGSIIKVGEEPAMISLPGNYQSVIAGYPERPSQIEFLRTAKEGEKGETVIKLLDGSLFILAGGGVDKNIPLVVETLSGRVTVIGAIVGLRFDPTSWIFEVDCVTGICIFEVGRSYSLRLTEGQRSTVDASGIPQQPTPVNLDLYANYSLEDFIPLHSGNTETLPSSLATDTRYPTPYTTPTQHMLLTETPEAPELVKNTTPSPDVGYISVEYPYYLHPQSSGKVEVKITVNDQIAAKDFKLIIPDDMIPVSKYGKDKETIFIDDLMRIELTSPTFTIITEFPAIQSVDLKTGKPTHWSWSIVAPAVTGEHILNLFVYLDENSAISSWHRSYLILVAEPTATKTLMPSPTSTLAPSPTPMPTATATITPSSTATLTNIRKFQEQIVQNSPNILVAVITGFFGIVVAVIGALALIRSKQSGITDKRLPAGQDQKRVKGKKK